MTCHALLGRLDCASLNGLNGLNRRPPPYSPSTLSILDQLHLVPVPSSPPTTAKVPQRVWISFPTPLCVTLASSHLVIIFCYEISSPGFSLPPLSRPLYIHTGAVGVDAAAAAPTVPFSVASTLIAPRQLAHQRISAYHDTFHDRSTILRGPQIMTFPL